MPKDDISTTIFIIAVFVVFIIVALFYENKKTKKAYEALALLLPGKLTRNIFRSYFSGEWNGVTFRIFEEKGKNVHFVNIWIKKEIEFKMRVYRKQFGIIDYTKVDTTGIQGYEDILIFASAKDESAVISFLQQKKVSEVMNYILIENTARLLKFKHGYILIRYNINDIALEHTQQLLAETVKKLCEMN